MDPNAPVRDGKRASELERLLEPEPFRRENYAAYLYMPYSRKLRRRTSFYQELGYLLWCHIETDSGIKTYNERVREIPVHEGDGLVKMERPTLVSKSVDGSFCTHLIVDAGPAEEKWGLWACAHGAQLKVWTREILSSRVIWSKNVRRMLKFVSDANYAPDHSIEANIKNELRMVRKITAYALVSRIGAQDENLAYCSLFELILSGAIYSDIEMYELSRLTELSIYHPFE